MSKVRFIVTRSGAEIEIDGVRHNAFSAGADVMESFIDGAVRNDLIRFILWNDRNAELPPVISNVELRQIVRAMACGGELQP